MIFLSLFCLSGLRASDGELAESEKRNAVRLRTALKGSALLSYAPDDPALYPERDSAVALLRARFMFEAHHGDSTHSELAYEQSARFVSRGAGRTFGGRILPDRTEAPYRIKQLEWPISDEGSTFAWSHEIDRALLALHPAWGEVTVGRQAIGLGRGVFFGAIDVFSPFTPLQADREWRRGVDALRVEYRLSPTTSTELIAAFGESWDESALLGRLRGYLGTTDAEIIVGKRAEDSLLGLALSTVMGQAEVHAEAAAFDTPGDTPFSGLFADDDLAIQAVLGSSYTFDTGDGLTVLAEYHYSGFGVREAENASLRLADPDFQERLLRGDMQILGRHALALRATYPFAPDLRGSVLVLGSPTDGSGVLSPSIRWDWTRSTTVTATGFLPWGPGPESGRLRSEYGARPLSLFLQIATYF